MAAAVVAVAAPAAASTLYVTNGDASRLAIVDTVSGAVTIKSTQQGQYPIAVSSSIWLGNYFGPTTSEYNLSGVATGQTRPSQTVFAVDGTTDGQYNYELGNAFSSSATVYRAGLDWSNPVAQFSVGNSNDYVGITYDSAAGSLWVSSASTMFQYTLTGTLLSQFNHSGSRGSLAYDGSSDTLWYVTNGSNTIQQYSKTGTLLSSTNAPGLSSNNWGAEIAFVSGPSAAPEPATWAIMLLGFGGMGAALRRRQRSLA